MSNLDFDRAPALRNIPSRKLELAIDAINNSGDTQDVKAVKIIAINRYYESNIPVEYWTLKMERDFYGDPRLKDEYEQYVKDMNASYINGVSICFAGGHGRGKTFVATSILKKACQKGFSCLHVTLKDVVSALIDNTSDDKSLTRRELAMVDFLVLDEFDNRFFKKSTDAADLYAQTLEGIFRTRSQNKIPTIMCTNSPNIVESFVGELRVSIDSLMTSYMKMFVVMRGDFRKIRWEDFVNENILVDERQLNSPGMLKEAVLEGNLGKARIAIGIQTPIDNSPLKFAIDTFTKKWAQ